MVDRLGLDYVSCSPYRVPVARLAAAHAALAAPPGLTVAAACRDLPRLRAIRLLLVRHAATAETGKVLSGRLPGMPLSPGGVEAAGVAGRALAESAVVAIVTPPMERCRQPADALATGRRASARVDKRYSEVDREAGAPRTNASTRCRPCPDPVNHQAQVLLVAPTYQIR